MQLVTFGAVVHSDEKEDNHRAVIKSRGPGIFPGYYESEPWLLS